jgi:hypothetical protein
MNNKDKTFENFDKYGLSQWAEQLLQYLINEYRFVDGSYVLSLNSEFGSGKSTFFEMWANKIQESNDSPQVVFLNAWESDFIGDPLLAIVSKLLESLESKTTSEKIEPLKETAGKLCKFTLSIGNDIVKKVTGADILKAGQYAESKGIVNQEKSGLECYKLFQEKQKLFNELRQSLQNLTENMKNPILIIIDELDRCRPTYAVEFLETIKHFFDIKGIIFVIGVDKVQLESSTKVLFGQQLIFDEYYRKFAHRNVSLPVKSKPLAERFCRELVKEYFSQQAFERRNRISNYQHDSYREENILDICIAFSLNARQIHELFRITSHVLSRNSKSNSSLLWGWPVGAFFMTALHITNSEFYSKLGQGKILISEFTYFLKKLSLFNDKERKGFWWAAILYLGAFNNTSTFEKEFQNLDVWDPNGKGKEEFQKELRGFSGAFSNFNNNNGKAFTQIYEILENLKTFEG